MYKGDFMLGILKYLFSKDTNYTRCIVCDKKMEETETNKYIPICSDECSEKNIVTPYDWYI